MLKKSASGILASLRSST